MYSLLSFLNLIKNNWEANKDTLLGNPATTTNKAKSISAKTWSKIWRIKGKNQEKLVETVEKTGKVVEK